MSLRAMLWGIFLVATGLAVVVGMAELLQEPSWRSLSGLLYFGSGFLGSYLFTSSSDKQPEN